jgi:hypothetical protein
LVEGKDKILNPELDGLQKHVRKWKALIFHPRILPSESYINNDNQHQKMKGLMLAKVQILLQSWWSMEGRQEREKHLSNLWQFLIS